MNPYEERRRALGHHRPCFGGDSGSSTSTATYNTDRKVTGGADSLNISADVGSGTLSVIQTDMGAVSAGLALGSKAIDASTKQAAGTQAAATELFDGVLSSVNEANKRLALAYQSGQAGDQTTLKYAGFIVVGLAAFAFLGRKV